MVKLIFLTIFCVQFLFHCLNGLPVPNSTPAPGDAGDSWEDDMSLSDDASHCPKIVLTSPKSGHLHSPNYSSHHDKKYPNNSDCKWIIQVNILAPRSNNGLHSVRKSGPGQKNLDPLPSLLAFQKYSIIFRVPQELKKLK